MLKRQGYVKRKARKVKAMGPRQVPPKMELQSRSDAHLNRQVIRVPAFGRLAAQRRRTKIMVCAGVTGGSGKI